MDDNSLLVIILAFIVGCMCSGMMKQMCGGRLVEGSSDDDYPYPIDPETGRIFICGYSPYGTETIMNTGNSLDNRLRFMAQNFEKLEDYLDCADRRRMVYEKKLYNRQY